MSERLITVIMRTNYAGPRGACSAGKPISLPATEARALIAKRYAEPLHRQHTEPVTPIETTEAVTQPETAVQPKRGKRGR